MGSNLDNQQFTEQVQQLLERFPDVDPQYHEFFHYEKLDMLSRQAWGESDAAVEDLGAASDATSTQAFDAADSQPAQTEAIIQRQCSWGDCRAIIRGSHSSIDKLTNSHFKTHASLCQWTNCKCEVSRTGRCDGMDGEHPAHVVDMGAHYLRVHMRSQVQ